MLRAREQKEIPFEVSGGASLLASRAEETLSLSLYCSLHAWTDGSGEHLLTQAPPDSSAYEHELSWSEHLSCQGEQPFKAAARIECRESTIEGKLSSGKQPFARDHTPAA